LYLFSCSPVIRFVKKIAGSPQVSVVGSFIWADKPTFGVLDLHGGCDKWVLVILAFLYDVDHHVAVIAMDDPRFA
jgi:hypothetical protein